MATKCKHSYRHHCTDGRTATPEVKYHSLPFFFLPLATRCAFMILTVRWNSLASPPLAWDFPFVRPLENIHGPVGGAGNGCLFQATDVLGELQVHNIVSNVSAAVPAQAVAVAAADMLNKPEEAMGRMQ